MVGRAFDRLTEEIARYGGLLEKFMGDAVLAVFGVPARTRTTPKRAVRAALEMQAVLSELNRGFAAEGTPRARDADRRSSPARSWSTRSVRAGPRDRMLTGDAVNMAARLQARPSPAT